MIEELNQLLADPSHSLVITRNPDLVLELRMGPQQVYQVTPSVPVTEQAIKETLGLLARALPEPPQEPLPPGELVARSVRDGDFEDPKTWGPVLPQHADRAIIAHNVTVRDYSPDAPYAQTGVWETLGNAVGRVIYGNDGPKPD